MKNKFDCKIYNKNRQYNFSIKLYLKLKLRTNTTNQMLRTTFIQNSLEHLTLHWRKYYNYFKQLLNYNKLLIKNIHSKKKNPFHLFTLRNQSDSRKSQQWHHFNEIRLRINAISTMITFSRDPDPATAAAAP